MYAFLTVDQHELFSIDVILLVRVCFMLPALVARPHPACHAGGSARIIHFLGVLDEEVPLLLPARVCGVDVGACGAAGWGARVLLAVSPVVLAMREICMNAHRDYAQMGVVAGGIARLTTTEETRKSIMFSVRCAAVCRGAPAPHAPAPSEQWLRIPFPLSPLHTAGNFLLPPHAAHHL